MALEEIGTDGVLWAERLSRMTWICCRGGHNDTTSSRKATKSQLVWRAAVFPCTRPVLVSSAAYRESVTLGSSRRERQNRIEPVQRLNRGFFIHTEDGGVLRRIQVQAKKLGSFAFELRIVTGTTLSDQVILIEGDKIASVGPARSFKPTSVAERIELPMRPCSPA